MQRSIGVLGESPLMNSMKFRYESYPTATYLNLDTIQCPAYLWIGGADNLRENIEIPWILS